MSNYHRLAYRLCLLAALSAPNASPAQTLCYKTLKAAVDSLNTTSVAAPVSDDGGYRVTNIQSDPVLEQRWAIVVSCSHPEWPSVAVPMRRLQTNGNGREAHLSPVVHAGDVVRLWKQEENLRIETAGVAEENGYPGKPIRVRLLHRSEEVPAIQQQIAGIVRGPADVEMQP